MAGLLIQKEWDPKNGIQKECAAGDAALFANK
jgi:hypothetical protein